MSATNLLNAIILSDNADFHGLLAADLTTLDIRSFVVTKPNQIGESIEKFKPSIIFFDLAIGPGDEGFDLLMLARSLSGKEIPMLALSRQGDEVTISRALENGADDFIILPIEFQFLANKLQQYLDSPTILAHRSKYGAPASGNMKTGLTFKLEIAEIDEVGIKLLGSHLISNGTQVTLTGGILPEVTNSKDPLSLKVVHTWTEPDQVTCGAFCEFDTAATALLANIKNWLNAQKKP